MAARQQSRRRAVQILYQWDMRKLPADDAVRAFYGTLYSEESATRPEPDLFMEALVRGTVAKREDLDAAITKHASNWRIERMPIVDRNILRLALYEILYTETAAAVAIDEALELARRFSSEESVKFVNGVLDAVKREGSAKD